MLSMCPKGFCCIMFSFLFSSRNSFICFLISSFTPSSFRNELFNLHESVYCQRGFYFCQILGWKWLLASMSHLTNSFDYRFTLRQCLSLKLRCVSYKQQIDGFFFSGLCLCLFIRELRPFLFKVITEMCVNCGCFSVFICFQWCFMLCISFYNSPVLLSLLASA